jgi:hypothetical protein
MAVANNTTSVIECADDAVWRVDDNVKIQTGDNAVLRGGDFCIFNTGKGATIRAGRSSRISSGDFCQIHAGAHSSVRAGLDCEIVVEPGARVAADEGSVVDFICWLDDEEKHFKFTVGEQIEPKKYYRLKKGTLIESN